MRVIILALAVLAGSAPTVASQPSSIARRVEAVRDGMVSMRFASVPGVCGDGAGSTWTRNGSSESWRGCITGPVHVVIGRADNATVSVRTTIGDSRRSSDNDIGVVSAPDAARYLLELAHSLGGRNASEAVSAAALADSANLSSEFVLLVQDANAAVDSRQQALFWLGQTRIPTSDLSRLYEGLTPVALREHFVFVMSQRRDETAIDKLIDIASHDADRDIRKNAMFWLGQTNNRRAVEFLHDLVTR